MGYGRNRGTDPSGAHRRRRRRAPLRGGKHGGLRTSAAWGTEGEEEVLVARCRYLIRSAGLHISMVLPKHGIVNMFGGARLESGEMAGFFFCAQYPSVCSTLGQEAAPMTTPKSLDLLEQRRINITNQIAALGDLRCGSITSTSGRCGKPNCHCHQPKDPG